MPKNTSWINPLNKNNIQRDKILYCFNETQADYPQDKTIHNLFEEQVKKTPGNMALVFEGKSLTYFELNQRANQLAHYLRKRGVCPDTLVGICVERSFEMIVGILGILKAGGAYVPIDPEYPKDRIQFMLEDTEVPILLTQSHLKGVLPEKTQASVIYLDTEWDVISQEDIQNPSHEARPYHLAYCIYTSGSTGKPKGSLILHNAVINRLLWMQKAYPLEPEDTILQKTSYAFDVSVWELFWWCLTGSRLCLLPPGAEKDPQVIAHVIEKNSITHLHFVPSMLRVFLESVTENPDAFRKLKTLKRTFASGENLTTDLARKFSATVTRSYGTQLHNLYGPTEVTVDVSYFDYTNENSGGTSVPIGRPISNIELFILDPSLEPVAIDTAGELYIGGVGLARSYLNRPDLTAEKFIPNPFAKEEGERLYRTGDVARYFPDGNIEFLGRVDHQVKIRGFRIECGEIEALLRNHLLIKEAVIIAREEKEGDKYLASYLTTRTKDSVPMVSDLRDHLKTRLPDYMIPAHFVFLDNFPLTPNGKLDRKALPEPDTHRPNLKKEYVAPRTPEEKILTEIFQEVLGIGKVGIHDNFFELGGDSIKAARVINQIKHKFNELIWITAIFDSPTVNGLCVHLNSYSDDVSRRQEARVTPSKLHDMRRIFESTYPGDDKFTKRFVKKRKNKAQKSPVFFLTTPRSGGTLLRVMLAGHDSLFTSPYLELLMAGSLRQRERIFSGKDSWRKDGLIRAIMHIQKCDVMRAKAMIHEFLERDMSTKECYDVLQEWLGDKLLVDKSHSYALSEGALNRAKDYFDNAKFIHLVRHPYAMIHSYVRAKFKQLFGYANSLSDREEAEMIWVISHQNIMRFLSSIPKNRKCLVRFEDLVHKPEETVRGICQLLEIEFQPKMLNIYNGEKMLDGVYPESPLLGDPQFFSHKRIDSNMADNWKLLSENDSMGEETLELAECYGYRKVKKNATQSIAPVPQQDKYPLSFAQTRLWFLSQLEPDNPFYNIPSATRLEGPLNHKALDKTIQALIERHDSFRTSFIQETGIPYQKVEETIKLSILLIDLSALSREEREREARKLAEEDALKPFDLTQAPLLRVKLLKLEEHEHIFLLNIHHIISDGWSSGIIWKEIAILYNAISEGRDNPLPHLKIQYKDYVLWQREQLEGEILNNQEAYWRSKFQGELSVLNLPTDHPRPKVMTYQGAVEFLTVPKTLTEKLKSLSQKQNVTLYMTLLSAFNILLSRYAGQEDIIVGSPIAGRHYQDTEEIVGFFVNTITLRTNLSGDPTFLALLAQVRENCLEAYKHQDFPFERLVEIINPIRDMSRSPLFQVSLAFQNAPGSDACLNDLTLKPLQTDFQTAKFDLMAFIWEAGDQLNLSFKYYRDIFERTTIQKLMKHFVRLLEVITEDPSQSISTLSVLDHEERDHILNDFNDTQRNYPKNKTIHELFEEQVTNTPHNIAVVFEDKILTYEELNQRANQLAHFLRKRGVSADTLVGICVERSFEMIIGILGILKAGGAYVPIDPEYPKERIHFMLEDTQTPILLAQSHLKNCLPEKIEVSVIYLDTEWDAISQESTQNPSREACPYHLAYCIYTSGSTGKPKGAVMRHAGVINLFCWLQEAYPIDAKDGILQKTTYTFDVSLTELLWGLAAGSRICFLAPGSEKDSQAVTEAIEKYEVTFVNFVPSLLNPFLDLLSDESVAKFKTLKTIHVAGEALLGDLAKKFQIFLGRKKGVGLYNIYGPTEATVYAAHFDCNQTDGMVFVPIGTPISNSQLYILGNNLEPLPIGATGELYIGGAGLARGYLNRTDLTAEKFIPNPFTNEAGERLYKTGDLGRYLSDGNIEFLGRIDHQVKIRGFRIECGEIETVLQEHAQIQSAVVLTREDAQNTKSLVAYLVLKDKDTSLTITNLRNYLNDRLPDYMIPRYFVFLEELPLTPNGKLDRKALPEPASLGSDLEYDYTPPRTPEEEMLVAILQDILGVQRVGIHDNFFDLGGHSLLATQVVNRIQHFLSIVLSIRNLFEHPTVSELQEVIHELAREGKPPLPSITPVLQQDKSPLSFSQQRLWFLAQLEPDNPFYSIPSAIRLEGQLHSDALDKAIQTLVQRHSAFRTSFQAKDGIPYQKIEEKVGFSVNHVDLLRLSKEERETEARKLAEEDALRPFDLTQAPLLRAKLLKLEEHGHILLLNMHHIISDGWSSGIIWKELKALYNAFSQGRENPLPALKLQYPDYAVWQRKELEGEVLKTQEEYWKSRFEGELPVLNLPTDHPRPKVMTYKGAVESLTVSETLTEKIKNLSKKYNVTPYMTLLTAFNILLSRHSGQKDIVVGSPIANRHYQDTEEIVGFFVNTLALRTNLSGDPTFLSLLERVRENCLEAYKHQDYPFERFVEVLNPPRDMSRSPLFQIVLAFQNAPRSDTHFKDLDHKPFQTEHRTTKFDLTAFVREENGQFVLVFEYYRDIFLPTTMQRLMKHFESLLGSITRDPLQTISVLSFLSAEERAHILKDFNNTKTDYPKDKTIHELFEEQVMKTPNNTAVVFEEKSLTYQELNQRANQLAHYLRKRGVMPDTLVGICVERSLEMIIGILGILKAGGAYLPIDSQYPKDRIHFMLEDTKTPLLLTQSYLKNSLPQEIKASVIFLDSEWQAISQEDIQNPTHEVCPYHLAYSIYTSGSTGRPKGTNVCHQSVSRLLFGVHYVNLNSKNNFLQMAPISFDASTFELWGALLHGARCVLYPERIPTSNELEKIIKEYNVNTLWLTASLFNSMMNERPQILSNLQQLLVGGEALSPSHICQAIKAFPSIDFINGYGPTESTTFTCCYKIPNDMTKNPIFVPIGQPIGNTSVYLLNPSLEPVPLGVPGELHIGGAGLARGYLNRPDLTAEKFIPNPFTEEEGERLYKTGDLARYLPDGNIEFLGRLDHQVKIRGFRIECGEIESVLRESPIVKEAVVIVRDEDLTGKQLMAYLVPGILPEEKDAETSEEKKHLSQWSDLYEDLYGKPLSSDPTLNFIGWNSSYTGLPIPEEEMKEWVNHTAQRIHSASPSRVLEIGCGTGLLLFRIAPECQEYYGTDFSKASIQYVQEESKRRNLGNIKLFHRTAEDFSGFADHSFDCVILNSVIQYFPDARYFLKVLEKVMKVLKPGGSIFLGDVRHLKLLKALHASIELYRAATTSSTKKLKDAVQKRFAQEEELLVDPQFFLALKQRFPQIEKVAVQPKRGRHLHNEVTNYRYDVLLCTQKENKEGDEVTKPLEVPRLDWSKNGFTLSTLRQFLQNTQPKILVITQIPNSRISNDIKILEFLECDSDGSYSTVEAIKQEVSADNGAIDPEDIWSLAKELSYSVDISWGNSQSDGSIDAIFKRSENILYDPFPEAISSLKQLDAYVNDPLKRKRLLKLVPLIRNYLKDKLPDYMIPSHFIFLETLPLTANGKFDRKALPEPDTLRPELKHEYISPRTPEEETLVFIFQEVLGIDKVGIHDNFFELGGHSLLATQVINRIRQLFSIDIPIRIFFEHPTVGDLQEVIETYEREGKALLPPITPVPHEDKYPLSFAQTRLWFLDQLEPNNPFYNMPWRMRLRGKLNYEALESGINILVQRHASFRTYFVDTGGTPYQRVEETVKLSIPLVDLSSLSKEERGKEARKLAEEDALKPFALTQAPLLRVKLVKFEVDGHVLLLNMHHIISDGWSSGIFWKELAALYNASCQGNDNPLSPLKIQYSDYAVWQRRELEGEVLRTQEEYWKKEFQGELPVLNLPTDHPRPKVMTYKGAVESLTLSETLTEKLKSLSKKYNVTPYMTLLTAFNILLSRYSGQEDIVVGSPIAGRHYHDTEEIIGFLVNTLALRTNLSGNPTFLELLKQVKENCLEAYKHQDYPFERLVEVLNPTRDMSRSPLFQVFYNFIDFADESVEFEGLEVSHFLTFDMTTKFDLTLNVSKRNGATTFKFIYNSNLFDKATVSLLLNHLQNVVEEVVAHPSQPISEVSLRVKGKLVKRPSWIDERLPTDNFTPFSTEEVAQFIPTRFKEQVERFPQHIAVKSKKYQWTYQELDFASNQIASEILSVCGSGAGNVALLMGHDAPAIASILGVLKAGKAYVPLDSHYPKERLFYVLSDSEAQGILTDSENLLKAKEVAEASRVPLMVFNDKPASEMTTALKTTGPPSALAYILYTSGTTGKPKGVFQNHENVLFQIRNYTNSVHINSNDHLTLFSSYCFDASVMDIFGALLNGASLHPIDVRKENVDDIVNLMDDEKITIYHSTPSLYRHLFRAMVDESKFAAMRLIVLGGEEAVREDAMLYKKLFSDTCLFVNGLGPTESTVSLQYFIHKDTEVIRQSIPVGVPVDGVDILLLDKNNHNNQLYGEIAIRSSHAALGYWKSPELTQAKFLFDADNDNRRIFKTGDLGRYLPDGNIEFLGRIDNQVKIRGFRIECGEIESVLQEHTQIQTAVVQAREDGQGDKYLAAHIVVKNKDTSLTVTDLRNYLKNRLPDYMIPSYFIILEKLPLTPNGKLDRKALPEPDTGRPELEHKYAKPNTIEEEIFISICKAVLQMDCVGVYDNLFDLGATSLKAVQICAQVKQKFEVALPVVTLFQKPTVHELYQEILTLFRKEQPSSKVHESISIQKGNSAHPIFCIAANRDIGFYFYHLMRYLDANQTVNLFKGIVEGDDKGEDGADLVSNTVDLAYMEEVLPEYVKEIERLDPTGPYYLAGYCSGGHLAYNIAQRLIAKGKKVNLLALIEAFTFKTITFKKEKMTSRLGRISRKVLAPDGGRYLAVQVYREAAQTGAKVKSVISGYLTRYLLNLSTKNRSLTEIEKFLMLIFEHLYQKTQWPVAQRVSHFSKRVNSRIVWKRFLQYLLKQPYDGKIDIFLAWDESREKIQDPLVGWHDLVKGGIAVHKINGDHNSVLQEPNLQMLAKEFKSCLNGAQPK